MGQLAEMFMMGLVIIGGYYIYKHPEIIEQIKTELGSLGGGNTGGDTTTDTTKTDTTKKTTTTKAKYVAVYSSIPTSIIRTPSTIY